MKKLALVCVIAGGCAKTASSDLLTHGMSADIDAKATGDGTTTVSATLFVGDDTSLNFVELQGDDELLASFDSSAEAPMNRAELGNIVSYSSLFQGDTGGTPFTVDFMRTLDDGAPDSSGKMPDAFSIDPTGTANSRAATLTLTWSPASTDLMRWDASGPCIEPEGEPISADTGQLQIDAGTFIKSAAQGTPDSCTIQISITREHLGTLDPGYGHGGQISGQQIRTVMFTSTP
jgi:hypothetical protein